MPAREPLVTGAQSCAFTGATRTELPDRDTGFPGPLSEIVLDVRATPVAARGSEMRLPRRVADA
jgi:hypothetical protein